MKLRPAYDTVINTRYELVGIGITHFVSNILNGIFVNTVKSVPKHNEKQME